MEEFIKDYFSILNLQKMPDEILTRLQGYIAKNSYPDKSVKAWVDNGYIINVSTDPANPKWEVKKDLPDLDPVFAEELYVSLFRAFRSMARNKWAFDDNQDAIDFVDKYFGPGKLFATTAIDPAVVNDAKTAVGLILTNSDVRRLVPVNDPKERKTLEDFVAGRASASLDKDDVKNLVLGVIYRLDQAIYTRRDEGKPVPNIGGLDLQRIMDGLDNEPNPTNTDISKLKGAYKDIFKTLYEKKDVREVFSQYDQDKTISGQIERALKLTDYTGKTNEKTFIPPKYDDKLNLGQRIDKELKDTYNDKLKKFVTMHRANLFIKPTAKAIFDALDKAKIAPTDGIKAIIEKKEDVLKSLKGKEPFDAAKQFDWLIGKLETYNKNGMGKAIEAALRNGHQMRHIVEYLIKDAVHEKKIENAKVAMEVLSVMQYGLFTSRTMDAINKTDVNIFSDGGLSWNKNDGIKFVTGALDKTIKFGIQTAGLGITAASNGIRRIGRSFNKEPGKIIKDALKKDETEKSAFEAHRMTEDHNDQQIINNNIIIRRRTGITSATIANERTNLENAKRTFEPMEEIHNAHDELLRLDNSTAGTPGRKQELMTEIATLQVQIRALPYPAPDPMVEEDIKEKMTDLKSKTVELNQVNQQINDINARYPNLNAEYARITTIPRGATKSLYDDAKDKHDDLEDRITKYDNAQAEIDSAQKAIDDRRDISDNWDANHKDVYVQLMAYWDFLQTGQTKSLFHWSTKNLQKEMDQGKMQAMLTQYTTQYAA